MGLFDPKCCGCGKRTSKSTFQEGYCPKCQATLEYYFAVRDLTKKLTGKTIKLDPKDVINMDTDEIQKALSEQVSLGADSLDDDPYDYSKQFSLEELRDRGVKRVKYITIGSDCPCDICRPKNGAVRSIDEAIREHAESVMLHQESGLLLTKSCGKWLPLRERPNTSE